jgi:hypothetical protein
MFPKTFGQNTLTAFGHARGGNSGETAFVSPILSHLNTFFGRDWLAPSLFFWHFFQRFLPPLAV